MRVLTFLHSFEHGGVERVALRLVRQWREIGIDAPLFIGRGEGALRSELADDLAFYTPPARFWNAALETLWMIWTLPGAIRRTKPDVLFCAGNTYTVVVAAMKLILGRRCPPVVAKVSNDLLRPGLSPAARLLFRTWAWLQSSAVDCWIVMHEAMREEIVEVSGSTPVVVIPDPALTLSQIVKLRSWHPRHPVSGRSFVALGRLVPQKNYEMLVHAFAAGASAKDQLTIYGDGPCRGKLKRLASQFGVRTRIKFAGHVADSSGYLIGQDALLMTSHYEGIPSALIEAMTCGMPIIVTDCGAGVRGLIEGYENAAMVANGDEDAFATSIHQLSVGVPQVTDFDAESFTVEAGAVAYVSAFARVCSNSASLTGPRQFEDELHAGLADKLNAPVHSLCSRADNG